jgi:hypothetical protein
MSGKKETKEIQSKPLTRGRVRERVEEKIKKVRPMMGNRTRVKGKKVKKRFQKKKKKK